MNPEPRPQGTRRTSLQQFRATKKMKTAVITGGNTGIGFETAATLASQGYRTIIACRDAQKGQEAMKQISARVPDGKIESQVLDLADFSSIHSFAKDLVSHKTAIDVLVNNAGVMMCPKSKTKDGLEVQMGVNHMGHFLLTSLLYPLMKNHKEEARIVNVSSSAHNRTKKIDFEDINSERDYSRWQAYCQSKLANVTFTYELARRIPKEHNITANVCHPGLVATELQRHIAPTTTFLRPLVMLANAFFKSPAQGAATSIYLASSPDVASVTGKYFANSKEAKSNPRASNEDDAKRLWNLSNELTGARWGI